MHAATTLLIACLAWAGTGCANGASGHGGTPDAGDGWGFGDGSTGCGYGEHDCGGRCVEDQPNEPEVGCREGCGEPCPAPEGAIATCTTDGRCDFECEAPLQRVGESCECVPLTCEDAEATCGMLDDGCGGTVECGTCGDGMVCVANVCSCPPDEAEDNDVQAAAFDLGDAPDFPRTEMRMETYGLHSAIDVDWYRVRVRDVFDFSNPNMLVTLADAAPGFVIGAWYVCDSGVNSSVCKEGERSTVAGPGCSSPTDGTGAATLRLKAQCTGTNDSGYLLVRVMATGEFEAAACTPYTLGIVVD